MFNSSSATNTSFGMPLDLGSSKKDLFNSSTSDFFDPPSPPGGPGGGGRSPLFDRPLYQIVPYQVIDLSFLRKLEVFNSILNTFGDLFSSKTQITQAKDLFPSKSSFPLHSKYDFSKLDASSIPPTILQCYGASDSKGTGQRIPIPAKEVRRIEYLQQQDARKFDLNKKLPSEIWTPVHTAVWQGHVDVLRFLATVEGVNLNQPNEHGTTPAYFAAEKGHVDILRFLATVEGINLNQPMNLGRTPAHEAVEGRRRGVDVLRFLATVEGVNLNQPNENGVSPASIAAKKGHVDVLRFLKTQPESKPGRPLDDNKGEGSVPPPRASAPPLTDEDLPPAYAVVDPMPADENKAASKID